MEGRCLSCLSLPALSRAAAVGMAWEPISALWPLRCRCSWLQAGSPAGLALPCPGAAVTGGAAGPLAHLCNFPFGCTSPGTPALPSALPAALACPRLFGFASLCSHLASPPGLCDSPSLSSPSFLSPQVWRTLGPFCEVNVIFALFFVPCPSALAPQPAPALQAPAGSRGLGWELPSPQQDQPRGGAPSLGLPRPRAQLLPSGCLCLPMPIFLPFFTLRPSPGLCGCPLAIPCSFPRCGHWVSCHTLVLQSCDTSHVLRVGTICPCRNRAISGWAGPSTSWCLSHQKAQHRSMWSSALTGFR